MKKLKNLLYAITLVLAVFTFGLASSLITPIYASSINKEYKSITLSNSSFDSSTSSTLDEPSSWTKLNNNSTAKSGVINTLSTKFSSYCSSYYYLSSAENPGNANGSEYKVLMMNTRTTSDGGETSTWQGYKSSDLTLSAYSQYVVSIWAMASGNASLSMSVTGVSDGNLDNNYISDVRPGTWTEYKFFISTNYETPVVNINLFLGNTTTSGHSVVSSGAVFFDEISVLELSENKYASEATLSPTSSQIDMPVHNLPTSPTFTFNGALVDWTQIGNATTQNYFSGVIDTTLTPDYKAYTPAEQKVLKISADENNAVYAGYKSPEIFIEQGQIYKLSLLVKTIDLSGNATIKLVESDYLKTTYNNSTTPKTSTISISNATTNQLTNDYSVVTFYIEGYELYDTEVSLELSLGNESANASGTVLFDNINLCAYPYKQFTDVSDSDLTKKIKFTSISGTPSFTNGYFNSAYSNNIIKTYPLTPTDWSVSSEDEQSSSFGVVNTAKWSEIPSGKVLGNSPLNPNLTLNGYTISVNKNASNNILYGYNNNDTYQKITSPTFSVDANSYYTLTFNYFVYSATADFLNIKLIDDSGNVVYAENNITSNTDWKLYTLTINTELFSQTLHIEFELGTIDNLKTGYAYFDNFQLVKESSYTATTFENIINNSGKVLDFSNFGTLLKGDKLTNYKMYTPLMFTGKLEAGSTIGDSVAIGGIIDSDNNYSLNFPTTHQSKVQNMLAVSTYGTANYSLTSKDKISLTKDSYYKFTIYIKTNIMGDNAPDAETDYGAYFKLVGLDDAKIENIKTSTSVNNGFELYTILIKCDEDASVNVQLGYSSDCYETRGNAFFDTFAFETIDKKAYTDSTASPTTLLVNNVATQDDEEETDSDPTTNNAPNIWILLSSLILVVAMIVAVVGGLLRKVEIKKIKVKKQAEYNREASLVRDVSVIEAEKRRDAEIKTLNKEKETLNAYILELEEDNKKRIAEERKVSGKRITRKSEKEFKLYASARQKLIRDIEKIDARIKDAKSPEYLLRIVKIVQKEKVAELNEKKSATITDTENK